LEQYAHNELLQGKHRNELMKKQAVMNKVLSHPTRASSSTAAAGMNPPLAHMVSPATEHISLVVSGESAHVSRKASRKEVTKMDQQH